MTIFITLWQLLSCFGWASSRQRGRVCLWYMLLALASAVFLGSSPLGLATIFCCLRFETSPFVVPYDSQGHGGGIRPRLHTGFIFSFISHLWSSVFSHILFYISLACPIGDTEWNISSLRCHENDPSIAMRTHVYLAVAQQPTVPAGHYGYVYQPAVTYAMESHVTVYTGFYHQHNRSTN
jgi:hypothetical protein